MPSLTQQRCFNHAHREAAARCVECRNFFCRECATEHDDQILCAACLQKRARRPVTQSPAFIRAARLAQCLFGVLLLWFLFYLAGEELISIPSSFHEGTLWHANWTQKE